MAVTAPAATRTRALAFALLARSLGRDTSCFGDADHIDALRQVAAELDRPVVASYVEAFASSTAPHPATLAGRWVRWFDLGRVPPYEGSNVVLSAGGVTPRLADIAGYYRAFGMQVVHDRPDHVVAELEFVAFSLVLEADADDRGDSDQVHIVDRAVRSFLRDHLGAWIDAWASRVAAIEDLAPWAPLARAAADLVAMEAALRNVIPTRTGAVLTSEEALVDEPDLECG